MTVMLHKYKITREKHVLSIYICCRKALKQLQYHLNVFSFSQKIRHSNDIATVWGCLSATNICKPQHIFHVQFYVYATQQSFRQGQSLNLKTCKSMNLQTINI